MLSYGGLISLRAAALTPRERAVIILRYGIDDGQDRSLREVGKALGISYERVRQLEVMALMKLRKRKPTPLTSIKF